jgi:arylamine N-acetyltransferase
MSPRRPTPLDPPPPDSPALALFARCFELAGLPAGAEPARVLEAAGTAFSRLPYENLTKIIKGSRAGSPELARRWPHEVLADHVRLGTGGTCFSLTAALLHIVRGLGFTAEPLLADRHYGASTHCALVVWLDGAPHLLDPGYLVVRPVPLPRAGEVRLATPFNEVVLAARDGGSRVELATIDGSGRKHRLTFRAEPADAGAFLGAWDASFAWDMMRYPVLTRVAGGRQLYLQGNRFQARGADGLEREEIDPRALAQTIAAQFGVDRSLALAALEVLRRREGSDALVRT